MATRRGSTVAGLSESEAASTLSRPSLSVPVSVCSMPTTNTQSGRLSKHGSKLSSILGGLSISPTKSKLLALATTAGRARFDAKQGTGKSWSWPSDDSLHRHYALVAAAASTATYGSLPPEYQYLLQGWGTPIKKYAHGQCLAHCYVREMTPEHHCCVFAIRGTPSLQDWMWTFDRAAPDSVTSTHHQGLVEIAEELWVGLQACLMNALPLGEGETPGEHTLILTGHSSGGGIAAILYQFLKARPSTQFLKKITRVHCITFGMAPTGEISFTDSLSQPDDLPPFIATAFINELDPVPITDFAYAQFVRELWAKQQGQDGSAAPSASSTAELLDQLHPRLSILGDIVLLKTDPSSEELEVTTCSMTQEQLWSRIWLDSRCNQMKACYLQSILKLCQDHDLMAAV